MIKNKISLFFFVLFIFSPMTWAEQVSEAPAAFSAATVEQMRLEIKALIADKNYLQAQKLLEELLQISELPEDLSEKIQNNYLKLNRKILFSKYETPDSVMHEVIVGDSLYKMAKQYKVTPGFIKRVNGLKKDTVFLGSKLKIPQGVFTVNIDIRKNLLTFSFNHKPIEQYPVATGSDLTPTPVGHFKVTDKLENPTWYKTGAVISPGSPENGLGTRWIGFDKKGYGIHGTNDPESIGKHASFGCVRLLNKNVEELYALIPSGAEITIVS